MNDLVERYGKEVMVVEVGGEDIQVQNTYDMLVAVIKKTAAVSENKGMGVIYWEPEGERNWSGGYPLSCWGANGKPTAALNAFLTNITSINSKNAPVFNIYPNPNTGGVLNFEFEKSNLTYAISIYDLEGRLLKQQTMSGFVKNSMRLDLIPGIYLVKVDDGEYYTVRKLVVR
jgi:arabinogalactan endo-1,4-beta-galactosidase